MTSTRNEPLPPDVDEQLQDDAPPEDEEEHVAKDAGLQPTPSDTLPVVDSAGNESAGGKPLTAEEKLEVDRAVVNLGAPRFGVRQEASRILEGYGARALSEIQAAANSSDAEVRQRAETLLQRIRPPKPDTRITVTAGQPPAVGGDGGFRPLDAPGTPMLAADDEVPPMQIPGSNQFTGPAKPGRVETDVPPQQSALRPPSLAQVYGNQDAATRFDERLKSADQLGFQFMPGDFNTNDLGHHGINARYVVQYFAAKDQAERRAALAGLQDQVLNHDNGSAQRLFAQLSLLDAAERLKRAQPGSKEEKEAIMDLACLEEGQKQARTGVPSLLDQLYPQGNMSQEERQKRIDAIRQKADEIVNKPEQATRKAAEELSRPGATAAERADALDTIKRVAQNQAASGDPRAAKAYETYAQMEQVAQMSDRLREGLAGVAGPGKGADADPVKALRDILSNPNDPVNEHARFHLLQSAAGRKLIAAAANGDPEVLQKAMDGPDVPPELKELLKGAAAARELRQRTAGGGDAAADLLQNLAGAPKGPEVATALARGDVRGLVRLMSDPAVREKAMQPVREQQTIAALEKLMQSQHHPTAKEVLKKIGELPEGQELLQAIKDRRPDRAAQILRQDGVAARILEATNKPAQAQQETRQLARTVTPEDFLKTFRDPRMVEAAREAAREWAKTNYAEVQSVFDDFLFKSRKDALPKFEQLATERLGKLGVDQLGEPLRFARSTHLASAVGEAKTPAEMADALSALQGEAERNNSYASVYAAAFGDKAQVDKLIKELREGNPDTAKLVKAMAQVQQGTRGPEVAAAIDTIAAAAGNGNEAARAMLKLITDEKEPAAAQVKAAEMSKQIATDSDTAYAALRANVLSPTDRLNDLRTRIILKGIGETSSSQAYDVPIERLREQAAQGNRQAADWLRWAETSRELATIGEAAKSADPAKAAGDAIDRLTKMAEGPPPNPYARSALTMVIAGNSPSERMQDQRALGNTDVNTDHPMYVPDLSKLPPEVQSSLRTRAMDSFEKQVAAGHSPTKQEAAMLALAHSDIHRDQELGVNPQDKPLADRIGAVLTKAVLDADPKKRTEAMAGIADVMRTDFDGKLATKELADIFIKGAQDPVFAQTFPMFSRWAANGHESSLRIMAAVAGGARPEFSRQAAQTLRTTAAVPGEAEKVRDVMVHAYNLHGDKSRLLETLGEVTRDSGTFNDAVHTVLRDGLKRANDGSMPAADADRLRHSAMSGMMANAEQLDDQDAKLLTAKLTPELIAKLMPAADKIAPAVQKQFHQELMAKIKVEGNQLGPETALAISALKAFPKSATAEDVQRLRDFGKIDLEKVADKETAAKLKYETAVTLIAIMTRGEGAAQKRAYDILGPEEGWPGLDKTDLRNALRDYALGRPTDLDVNSQVARLVYDAGLPRPTAGLFKDVGLAGTDREQFQRADEAIRRTMAATGMSREDAERHVRTIINRVDEFNSLNPAQRANIGREGAPVDPRLVAGAIINGKIFDPQNPYNFLTGDVDGQIKQLRATEAANLAALGKEMQELQRQRQDVLREMGQHTSEGVDIFDRIGHVTKNIYTLGFGETDIDRYHAKQSEQVRQVRALEQQLKETQERGGKPAAAITFYDLARETGEWSRLMQQGRTKEADKLAVNMWGTYGSQLQTYAPAIWTELTRTGNRPIDRNAFQRLHENGMAQFLDMPHYRVGELAGPNGNPPSGLSQALTVLRDLKPYKADTHAVRQQALQAVDSDPNFARLVVASGSFAQDMSALFGDKEKGIVGMFEAGMKGTKYDTFVNDVRERGANIQRALDSVPQETVRQAKQQIEELKAAAAAAQDSETRAALNKRVAELSQVVKIFDRESTDNPSMRQQIERMTKTIASGQFDENTFANWLKKEGIIYAVAIAAAVATVATMGAASPLLVAAVASGVAIVASEVTQEILFASGSSWGPGQPSKLGAYCRQIPEIDPATGRERPREFFKDVALPYAKQWAMDTLICLGTMGLGKAFSSGINRMGTSATNFLARNSQTIARMQASMQKFTTMAAHSPASRSWASRTLREFADEAADEFKEEMAETFLQKALGRNSEVWGFLAASGVAMGKGINFHRVSGTNFIGLTDAQGRSLSSTDTEQMAKSYEQHGAKVFARADGMSWEIRMPDGGKFIVAPKDYLAGNLPPAELGPSGKIEPNTKSQTLNPGDTVETRKAQGETATLGDANWQPTPDSLKVRQDLQEFTKAMAAKDYARALQIAQQGGLSPNPNNLTNTQVEVRLTAADLQNPSKLQEVLARMHAASTIIPDAGNRDKAPADRKYEVRTPRPLVEISPGVLVDLTKPLETAARPARALTDAEREQVAALQKTQQSGVVQIAPGVSVDLKNPDQTVAVQSRALTDAEKAQVQKLAESDAGKRLLQEQALCTMEESLVHLSQYQMNGQVVSPTYAKFLAERGRAPSEGRVGDDYYEALRAGDQGGSRSVVTAEQELIALAYDSGMSIAEIEHHFGRQHEGSRKPIIDYLKQIEGRAVGVQVASVDGVTTGGDISNQPLGRTPTSEQLKAELTRVEAAIDATELSAPDKAKAKEALRQALDSSTAHVDNLRAQLGALEGVPPAELARRVRLTSDILAMKTSDGNQSVRVEALLNADSEALAAIQKNLSDRRAGNAADFDRYVHSINTATGTLNPQSRDYKATMQIVEASLRGAPINMEHVARMTDREKAPIVGLLQRRADIEAAQRGDATAAGKVGNAPAEQLARMKATVDAALALEADSPADYSKQLTELNSSLGKALKMDGPQREAAIAAIEQGLKPPPTATDNLGGGWTQGSIDKFKEGVRKVPGGEAAVDALVAAGVPRFLLAGMGPGIMAQNGPAQFLTARNALDAQIQNGTLPSHISPEQAVQIRNSMDALLKGQGSIDEIRNSGSNGGKEVAADVWRANIQQFNTLLAEIQKPPTGADGVTRTQALTDILASSGKVPFTLPLAALASKDYPVENIQRFRDWVKQMEGYSPRGAAGPNQASWTQDMVMARTLASSTNPALKDWAYVPSQPGSRADLMGIDGVFFNLKTGQVRPIDYKQDKRDSNNPVEQTTQRQPFELHMQGINFHQNPEAVIAAFFKRPQQCGFDSNAFSRTLGPLAKDFPGGIPPLRTESGATMADQVQKMEAYVKAVHDYAKQVVRENGGLPASMYRIGQGAEASLYHMKAKLELSTQLPNLLRSGTLKPLPEGGYELTLNPPHRVYPDFPRRYSDGTPYDITSIRIGRDGSVTALRKDYSGDMSTQLDDRGQPIPGRPGTDAPIPFNVASLPDIYNVAKQHMRAQAETDPALKATLDARLAQMDADLAALQQQLKKPRGDAMPARLNRDDDAVPDGGDGYYTLPRQSISKTGQPAGTPLGDTYHDVGMHRGKNAIEGLEGILTDGLIRGSTDKGAQVSQNGGPTNWWDSDVTIRIQATPDQLGNVGTDPNAPAYANWFGTGARGTPIDINGKKLEVIVNGKDHVEIAARIEQAQAAVDRANAARKANGLPPLEVKVQSVAQFLTEQRFPELAASLPEGDRQAFLEGLKKSPLSAQKAVGDLAAQMTPEQFADAYNKGWKDALATAREQIAQPPPRGIGSAGAFNEQFAKLSVAEQLVLLENVRTKQNMTLARVMDDLDAKRPLTDTTRAILDNKGVADHKPTTDAPPPDPARDLLNRALADGHIKPADVPALQKLAENDATRPLAERSIEVARKLGTLPPDLQSKVRAYMSEKHHDAGLTRDRIKMFEDLLKISSGVAPADMATRVQQILDVCAPIDAELARKPKLPTLEETFDPAQQARIKEIADAQAKLPVVQLSAEQIAKLSADMYKSFSEQVPGGLKQGKQMHIVLGPPGSGKSSAVANQLARTDGALVPDADMVKPKIPGYTADLDGKPYVGLGNQAVHPASTQVVQQVLERAIANGDNLVLQTVGRTPEQIAQLVMKARAAGYDVHLHDVMIDPKVSAQRTFDRSEQAPDEHGIRQVIPPAYVLNQVGYRPEVSFDRVVTTAPWMLNSWHQVSNNDVPRGTPPVLVRSSGTPPYPVTITPTTQQPPGSQPGPQPPPPGPPGPTPPRRP